MIDMANIRLAHEPREINANKHNMKLGFKHLPYVARWKIFISWTLS
jgi:hypothetical protein